MFNEDYDEGLGMGWDREDDLQDRMDNEAWEDAQLEMEQDSWDDEDEDEDFDLDSGWEDDGRWDE